MMRQSAASKMLWACAWAAVLALAGVAGCRHTAAPVPALKATAAGTALVESSGGHQVGATGTASRGRLFPELWLNSMAREE